MKRSVSLILLLTLVTLFQFKVYAQMDYQSYDDDSYSSSYSGDEVAGQYGSHDDSVDLRPSQLSLDYPTESYDDGMAGYNDESETYDDLY